MVNLYGTLVCYMPARAFVHFHQKGTLWAVVDFSFPTFMINKVVVYASRPVFFANTSNTDEVKLESETFDVTPQELELAHRAVDHFKFLLSEENVKFDSWD